MTQHPFQISIGSANSGWCDFRVFLHGKSWHCRASCIAQHPIHSLLFSITNLHYYLFVDHSFTSNPVWDCKAVDEPGGICIRLSPEFDHLIHLAIYQCYDDDVDPDRSPKMYPVAEALLDFWEIAACIHAAARQCLIQQSLTELRTGWLLPNLTWSENSHSVFLLEHYFHLSELLQKVPKITISETGSPKIIQLYDRSNA